jgi:hypothetical protein
MAFPETILPIQVDISLDGSTWTDITSDVRREQQIRITRGRSDWGQQVDFGRCSFALSNTDGTYSPRNPEGIYYEQIGRNTPVRVSVESGSVAAVLPGAPGDFISTPDDASLDITGDIDIRFDATLANWVFGDSTSTRTELIGKAAAGQRSWSLYIYQGTILLEWTTDGSTPLTVASTQTIPVPASGRLAVRATLDVDDGASGRVARFYTSDSIDGVWVQLGTTVSTAGTTSIFSGTASLRVGEATSVLWSEGIGYVHAAEVRSGIGASGTVVADPDFSAQTSGATSFVDDAGRTWTTAGNTEISNRKIRFVGEISSWTPRWETGGFDVVTEVEASGLLRRLGQGSIPIKSPVYREFTNPARSNIIGYWPMEDEETSTALASAISGHPAFAITGTVTPAAYSDWTASAALPTIGTGSLRVSMPSYTATSEMNMRFFAEVPAAGVVSTQRLISFTTTGTARTWSLYVSTTGGLELEAYDADGATVLNPGSTAFGVNGLRQSIGIELTQDGADVDWTVFVMDIDDTVLGAAVAATATGTLAGYTFGRITQIRLGEDGAMNSTAVGHLAVADAISAFANTTGALIGWDGEIAASRVHRLGEEEDFHSYATRIGDEQMGVQSRSTILDLLRQAEAVDEGILCEQRDLLGLRLVQRRSLYDQTPSLILDYTGSDGLVTPLDPVEDDQGLANDVTVQRSGGSSARVSLDEGILSTQAPPDGVGLYDVSHTLSLYDDDQPAFHAGWRLHLGTQDELRVPVVSVNLAAAPASIDDAASVDIGSRIQITNPPVWMPPDTVDLMVQGYSEVLANKEWSIAFNCSPYAPWDVAQAGGGSTVSTGHEFSWADTDGSELAEALTTTETDVDLLTTSGPGWTDDVENSPYDLRVGGEVMTVTAPGSLLNSNPFFDSDTTDWTGQNATISRVTTANRVHPHPRAVASLFIAPNGSSASGGATCTLTSSGTITPGAQYAASLWAYTSGGWSDLRPAIDWYTSGGSFISSGLGSGSAVGEAQWTYLEQTLTAPATASRAVMRARHGGTPSVSDTWYVWGARITRVKASAVYEDFGRTETDTWGTAESGQAWTNSGGVAADYDIGGSYGTHTHPSTLVSHISRIASPSADTDLYCDIATAVLTTGSAVVGGPVSRCTGNDNFYTTRISFNPSGTIAMVLQKRVSSSDTTLASYTAPFTHAAATFYRVRLQVIGTSIKSKFWLASELEPGHWHMEATDSSLTDADNIGVRSFRESANTNANAEIRWDNINLVNPQTFTVIRSQNGVVKTHTAGTDVRLAYPAYAAL